MLQRMIPALRLYVSSPSMARCATVVERALVAAAALAALLATPLPAIGQSDPSATLTGRVVDATGAAIRDATVTLEGFDTPARLVTTSNSSGEYLIRQIAPGRYHIRAEAPGFAPTTRELRIVTGTRPSVTLQLHVAPLTEAVDVVAPPLPPVDRASPFQRIVVPGDLQRSVTVTRSRDWSDVLAMAPGAVSSEIGFGTGNRYSYYGAPTTSNTVRVDGLAFDNPFLNGTLQLSTAAIRESEIKSGVSDASAPLGLGAVVNVVTESGQDTLHMQSEYMYLPTQWNSSNVQGGTSASATQHQVDISAGGPIVPRWAWAFGTYRYSQSMVDVARTPEQLNLLQRLVPNYQPTSQDSDGHFLLLKGQYSPAGGHQLGALLNRDKRRRFTAGAINAGRTTTIEGGHGAGFFARSAWSPSLATSFTASWNGKGGEAFPEDMSGNPKTLVFRNALNSGGVLVGDSQLAEFGPSETGTFRQPSSEVVVHASVQYTRNALGMHDVRTGIDLTPWKTYVSLSQRFPNVAQIDAVLLPDGTLRPFSRLIYTQRDQTSSDVEGSQVGFFIQDTWKVHQAVTLTLGLRADRIALEDRVANREVINGWFVGPRLGTAWSLDPSANWLLRVNGGRVHESLANNMVSFGVITAGLRNEYDVNGDGVFETARETPATTTGIPANRRVADGGVRQPYVDEFGATLERRLNRVGTLSAGLKRRWFRDRFVFVESNRAYDGRRFVGYHDESMNDLLLAANNEWNTPVVTSLEAVLQRDTGAVAFLLSYARQWRHLDGTWEPDDIAGILQPDSFAHSKGIGSTFGARIERDSFANALGIGGDEWRDHAVRAVGNIQLPFGISTGAIYTWHSGLWSGPILRTLSAPDPTVGPPSMQVGGRTVSNPLTTLFRFAGNTRDDGQFRYPHYHTLNLRAIREGHIGRQRWAVGLEVLNVANWGNNLRQFARSSIIQGSPDFGKSAFTQRPRSATLVLRTSF